MVWQSAVRAHSLDRAALNGYNGDCISECAQSTIASLSARRRHAGPTRSKVEGGGRTLRERRGMNLRRGEARRPSLGSSLGPKVMWVLACCSTLGISRIPSSARMAGIGRQRRSPFASFARCFFNHGLSDSAAADKQRMFPLAGGAPLGKSADSPRRCASGEAVRQRGGQAGGHSMEHTRAA